MLIAIYCVIVDTSRRRRDVLTGLCEQYYFSGPSERIPAHWRFACNRRRPASNVGIVSDPTDEGVSDYGRVPIRKHDFSIFTKRVFFLTGFRAKHPTIDTDVDDDTRFSSRDRFSAGNVCFFYSPKVHSGSCVCVCVVRAADVPSNGSPPLGRGPCVFIEPVAESTNVGRGHSSV